jgi:hypothetical protein
LGETVGPTAGAKDAVDPNLLQQSLLDSHERPISFHRMGAT